MTELKDEYKRRKSGKEDDSMPTSEKEEASLDALGLVLDDIHISDGDSSNGAASRLARKLATASGTYESHNSTIEAVRQPQEKPAYTITYAPKYQQNNTLAKVADFDARLAMLETVLGVEAIPLASQELSPAKAVIPTLDTLDKQMSSLSSSTELSLDSVSRRVRQLTQDAEKLDEARKSAKAAQDELMEIIPQTDRTSLGTAGEAMSDKIIDHFEQSSKINALYGTLATIEPLTPLLPSLLDRLRSLRYIHADAATASQSLARVEAHQEAMVEEIKGWKEGLEKVEKAMEHGEQTTTRNTKMVEGWVKELEDRMQIVG